MEEARTIRERFWHLVLFRRHRAAMGLLGALIVALHVTVGMLLDNFWLGGVVAALVLASMLFGFLLAINMLVSVNRV